MANLQAECEFRLDLKKTRVQPFPRVSPRLPSPEIFTKESVLEEKNLSGGVIFSFRRDREIAEVAISTMILRPLVAPKETEKLGTLSLSLRKNERTPACQDTTGQDERWGRAWGVHLGTVWLWKQVPIFASNVRFSVH